MFAQNSAGLSETRCYNSRQDNRDYAFTFPWALETRAYGYGKALRPLNPVAPQADANPVEYRRDGVMKWYENGPLEQGFTRRIRRSIQKPGVCAHING